MQIEDYLGYIYIKVIWKHMLQTKIKTISFKFHWLKDIGTLGHDAFMQNLQKRLQGVPDEKTP